jgi:hypothetical protein
MVNTTGTKSNRDGIGARVRVVLSPDRELHGFVSTAGSYLSSSDKRVHFGLGDTTEIRHVEISWPSGAVQRFENVAADRILEAREQATRE